MLYIILEGKKEKINKNLYLFIIICIPQNQLNNLNLNIVFNLNINDVFITICLLHYNIPTYIHNYIVIVIANSYIVIEVIDRAQLIIYNCNFLFFCTIAYLD